MISISTVLYIMIAIIVFGVLIFVHEFGHFLAARACGIRVNEFAIGMGPKIFSRKKNDTLYSLRILPIGGFCAMEGEEDESHDEHAYSNKPRWQRAIVLVAGAFMNVLLGFLIIFFLILSPGTLLGSTTVAEFGKDATSAQSGLQAGDQILRINGSATHISTEVSYDLLLSNGSSVEMQVLRGGKKVDLPDVKFKTITSQGMTAIQQDFYVRSQPKNFFSVLYHSYYWTVANVKLVWVSLIKIITGKFGLQTLSGPVGVTAAMGQAASHSMTWLLEIVAMIAVNLGVVNLLPLPALDGGKLLFVVIEAIRRKPVNPKYEGWVHFAGFALLMLLLVVVTYNDIVRLVVKG